MDSSSIRNCFLQLEPSVPPKRLILFLIAAFCRLAKLLSYSEHMRWLVGAVGIESNEKLYLKDLRGMRW